MIMRRRTCTQVFIARPAPMPGKMGEANEQFAASHLTIDGMLLPADGNLSAHAAGLHAAHICQLLLPAGADIRPGDGVSLDGNTFVYRVTRCDRYPLHTCAYLEARVL